MGHLLSLLAFFEENTEDDLGGENSLQRMILGVGDNGIPGQVQLFTDFLPDIGSSHKASIENDLCGESSPGSSYVDSSGR